MGKAIKEEGAFASHSSANAKTGFDHQSRFAWISGSKALHHESGVLTPKAEARRNRGSNRHFTRAVGNVVKIASRVGLGMVDGGWQYALVKGKGKGYRLHGASRSNEVSQHG